MASRNRVLPIPAWPASNRNWPWPATTSSRRRSTRSRRSSDVSKKEYRMRRSLLATITVLGALICLVGGTGLFAALTDTATTGTNTATSDDLPSSIDIKLGAGYQFSGGVGVCGAFVYNLTTPLFTETDMKPNNVGQATFCIKNDG